MSTTMGAVGYAVNMRIIFKIREGNREGQIRAVSERNILVYYVEPGERRICDGKNEWISPSQVLEILPDRA